MDRAYFWKLIERSRPKNRDPEKHAEKLEVHLSKMSAEELFSFEMHVAELNQRSYDARLWDVMSILSGGGPGDDGFDYFRYWLILQGEEVYNAILEKPERIPEMYPPGTNLYCYGLGGVVFNVLEEKYPSEAKYWEDKIYEAVPDYQLIGERLPSDEDLQKAYPELWEKYADGGYD